MQRVRAANTTQQQHYMKQTLSVSNTLRYVHTTLPHADLFLYFKNDVTTKKLIEKVLINIAIKPG